MTKLRVYKIRSSSNPSKKYKVTVYDDGSFWCTCPAMRFQGVAAKNRQCKHTRQIVAKLAG